MGGLVPGARSASSSVRQVVQTLVSGEAVAVDDPDAAEQLVDVAGREGLAAHQQQAEARQPLAPR
jgi:hypothetical protein